MNYRRFLLKTFVALFAAAAAARAADQHKDNLNHVQALGDAFKAHIGLSGVSPAIGWHDAVKQLQGFQNRNDREALTSVGAAIQEAFQERFDQLPYHSYSDTDVLSDPKAIPGRSLEILADIADAPLVHDMLRDGQKDFVHSFKTSTLVYIRAVAAQLADTHPAGLANQIARLYGVYVDPAELASSLEIQERIQTKAKQLKQRTSGLK